MTANRPDIPMSDLETLSALYDGELDGDAARFAMKRLGHDAEWQQACGNWQLIGDALRGRATSAAADDFAARVAEGVKREAVPFLVPELRTAAREPVRAKPRRWVAGAALAATMAAAALFVVRPEMASQPSSGPAIATASSGASPVAPEAPAPIVAPPDAVQSLAAAEARPQAELAAAEVASRRSSGIASRPAALRGSAPAARDSRVVRARLATSALAAESVASATSGSSLAEAATDPFRPSEVPIATRPWPRAVLPGSAAAGALTASFGNGAQAGSPSFYPFEPRLPAEPAADAPQP